MFGNLMIISLIIMISITMSLTYMKLQFKNTTRTSINSPYNKFCLHEGYCIEITKNSKETENREVSFIGEITNDLCLDTELPFSKRICSPPKHIHFGSEETFTLIEGKLLLIVNNTNITLEEKGSKETVIRGTPHTWYSASKEKLKFKVTITPAIYHEEEFFEQFAGINRDSKDNYRIVDL
jgi:mannose-6-phosphate isomerase-like protein (cupin superfamily)